MKSLILAEKPSVAKDMARVLKCNKANKGYFEGRDYIITWALGHLATLWEPGDYEARYKNWNMADLPMLPEKLKVKKLKKTGHQLSTLTFLTKRKDIKEFIIATDAGREGELVARWAMLLAGYKGKIKRLWISSQTDKAITEGFKNLKDGRKYQHLYEAAVSRAEADWLIGLNVTRALTCKYDVQLSAGRVQTPTLAMLAAREEEIKNFVPKSYYQIRCDFGGFFGHWRSKKNKSTRIFNDNTASEIMGRLEGKKARVVKVEEKSKKEYAPKLYDLTELQREANKRFGYSAKKTLGYMQTLYERHKVLTYPRTDSRYITTDIVETISDRLKALEGTSHGKLASNITKSSIKLGKSVVDDKKVSDHHAIIPTEERPVLSKLTFDEKRIYDLVVKRFLAVLLPPAVYKDLTIITEIEGNEFISRGRSVQELGWKKVLGGEGRKDQEEESLPEQNLISPKVGETLGVKTVKREKGKTNPPKRFTEGTLLSAMENPGKYVESKDAKAILSQGGLGTPATRAEIIEKLIGSFYVERNGKTLIPTSKGKQLIEMVPSALRSPELTAKWEKRLEEIAKGKEKRSTFMKDIRDSAIELVGVVKSDTKDFKHDNVTKEKCPMCSKPMLSVKDKKGRAILVCQDRKCGYRDEKKKKNDYGISMSKRERGMNKRLINQYSDQEEAVTNLGDLLAKFNK